MAVFEQVASVRSSAIAGTYVQAAGQINVQCGPGFVNASLPAAVVVKGSAEKVGAGMGMGGERMRWLGLIWMVVFAWLI